MSNYRRLYLPGGTYFFTVVTHRRRPLFDKAANINTLRDAFRHVRRRRPFELSAIVILPDHLHCIWRFDNGDVDFSIRWQMVKSYLSRRLSGPEKPVWQHRFWEHAIRNERDLHRHLDYIHFNPVKHGYVQRPDDWRWSSFRKFLRLGWYEENWGTQSDAVHIDELDFE